MSPMLLDVEIRLLFSLKLSGGEDGLPFVSTHWYSMCESLAPGTSDDENTSIRSFLFCWIIWKKISKEHK